MGLHLSPTLASCLAVAAIIFLFRRDIREKPDITAALWLPLLWLVLGCSRSVSAWLNIFGLPVSGAPSVEEGSPLDAWVYFALIIAGFCVLAKDKSVFQKSFPTTVGSLFSCSTVSFPSPGLIFRS